MASNLKIRLLKSIVFLVCIPSTAIPQSSQNSSSLIVAGQNVGLLHLGDSRQRAEQLFPFKKNMDQEWTASDQACGTTILWIDQTPNHDGNVFIHIKDGVVFQIDSATASFHTADGITELADPKAVRHHYPRLRAYVLSEGTSQAEGMRPLVYWTDRDKGIAFAFSYSQSMRKWYLYHTIVFKPGAEICPEPEPLARSEKKELRPYSLAPDDYQIHSRNSEL